MPSHRVSAATTTAARSLLGAFPGEGMDQPPGACACTESLLAGALARRIDVAVAGGNPSPATPMARVRELAEQGMRPAAIAKALGMSRKDVSGVLNRTRTG